MENRKKIAELYKDPTLSPRTRNNLILKLMNANSNIENFEETSSLERNHCTHYKRECLVECSKCSEFVECRLCHPELDRFKIEKIKCKVCNKIQSPNRKCIENECGVIFGIYFCDICNLWDSTEEKPKYHCYECGICRVGNRDDYRHCVKCGMCLLKTIFDDDTKHSCNEYSFKSKCSVCLEDMFSSTRSCQMLKCGHAMHGDCFNDYIQNDYRCPTCKKSIANMNPIFKRYDEILGNDERNNLLLANLPDELKSKKVERYCNDCGKKSSVNFNPFGLYKCSNIECGSYNTQ